MAKVRLRRDRSFFGALVPFSIELGTRRVALLWAGQAREIDVDSGLHRLTVRSGRAVIGGETVPADDGKTLRLCITQRPGRGNWVEVMNPFARGSVVFAPD